MKRTDRQGPLRGDSQLVPNDGNAVVGGNSTAKSIASQTAKRPDRKRRGAPGAAAPGACFRDREVLGRRWESLRLHDRVKVGSF
jgi:hypothetical protein